MYYSFNINLEYNSLILYFYIKLLCRVKSIKGLRVADASVMRHVTSGNTNAPVIMIGEKAADLIRLKDTVQIFRDQIKHLNL